tara:strand:- start:5343 stop:5543 length:201 start_codon:yes stop_codon:yes gene_type:complete
MKFKRGDLVVHAKGTIHPFRELRGVVIDDDIFEDSDFGVCRVFWYTTCRYQNIQEDCLKPLDNSLT